MGYGYANNSSHFTGKTGPACKSKKKRVVREPQKPHKNKYAKYSNVE